MRATTYLLLGTAIMLCLATAAFAEDPVDFADPNLQGAVEGTLSLYDPTPTDMLYLEQLVAERLSVADLTGLEYAVNLTHLWLDDNRISNISVLGSLTSLQRLLLNDNQISDISVLASLTSLELLGLDDNQVSNVSPLAGLVNVYRLHLGSNQISDISALAGLTNLTYLWLDDNQISNISALAGLTNLGWLDLYDNQISDLSALVNLTSLQHLGLADNQISDISVPAGLTNLQYLGLSNNQITGISMLGGLTELTSLWLDGNHISDISALANLTNLELLGLDDNQISDISALEDLTHLTYLDLRENPLDTYAYTTCIPQIIANNPGILLYYHPYGAPYDAVPVYRFWSDSKSRHFYTVSESEKAKLINNYANVWTFEGTAYYAFADDSEPNVMPVYRFWSDRSSSHFYTISEAEKTKLIDNYPHVWTFEGPAFYAYLSGQQPAEASPVHRFWSDSKRCHFYTVSESEKAKLIDNYSHVWTYEGIAWYAYQ